MLVWLRWWADLLDSKFRIPGTNIRFGIDPILSLVPGIGELASPLFTALILTQALRQRVPAPVIVRMVMNALIDAAVGAVPVAGAVEGRQHFRRQLRRFGEDRFGHVAVR